MQVTNANVGTLPKVMCYLAVHPVHGTHAFFPYHGARHGGSSKEENGHMYQDFMFWWHGVDDIQLKKLIKVDYCNSPAARTKSKSPAPGTDATFDPKGFLVCPPLT